MAEMKNALFVNLENERYNEMLKNTKRELSADEASYALGLAAEAQRKLEISRAIAEGRGQQ